MELEAANEDWAWRTYGMRPDEGESIYERVIQGARHNNFDSEMSQEERQALDEAHQRMETGRFWGRFAEDAERQRRRYPLTPEEAFPPSDRDVSVVDMMRPHQVAYNTVMSQMRDLMAEELRIPPGAGAEIRVNPDALRQVYDQNLMHEMLQFSSRPSDLVQTAGMTQAQLRESIAQLYREEEQRLDQFDRALQNYTLRNQSLDRQEFIVDPSENWTWNLPPEGAGNPPRVTEQLNTENNESSE